MTKKEFVFRKKRLDVSKDVFQSGGVVLLFLDLHFR